MKDSMKTLLNGDLPLSDDFKTQIDEAIAKKTSEVEQHYVGLLDKLKLEYNTQIQTKDESIQKLEKKNKRDSSRISNKIKREYNSQIQELKSNIKELQEDCDSQSRESETFIEEIEELKSEKKALAEKLREFINNGKSNESLIEEIEELKSEKKALAEKLREFINSGESHKTEIAKLTESNERLREKEIADINTSVKKKVREYQKKVDVKFEERISKLDGKAKEYAIAVIEDIGITPIVEEVASQWLLDNTPAIENMAIREFYMEFIGGLKNLFESHDVIMPDKDSMDLVEKSMGMVKTLEDEVEQLKEERDDLQSSLDGNNAKLEAATIRDKKNELFNELTKGMALSDKTRIKPLAESLAFDGDEDDYVSKLKRIVDSYNLRSNRKISLVEDTNFATPPDTGEPVDISVEDILAAQVSRMLGM